MEEGRRREQTAPIHFSNGEIINKSIEKETRWTLTTPPASSPSAFDFDFGFEGAVAADDLGFEGFLSASDSSSDAIAASLRFFLGVDTCIWLSGR